MATQKWDPFRDMVSLRDAMNTLFDDSVVRGRTGTGGGFFQVGNPMPLDVRETSGAYVVELVAAGAAPEDVNLSILGDTLRISATVRDREAREGETWLVRERRFGNFERTVTLPTAVKADEATAEFEHGILRITLPRADVARPRQIPVRLGSTQAAAVTSGETAPEPVEIEAQVSSTEEREPVSAGSTSSNGVASHS